MDTANRARRRRGLRGKRRRGLSGKRRILAAAGAIAVAGLAAFAIPAIRGHRTEAGFSAAAPGASSRAFVTPSSASAARTPPSASASASASAHATQPAAKAPRPSVSTPPYAPVAGRIQPGVTYQGVATEYSAGDGNGACLFGPAADMMIAAMNYTDYESSKACGDYIQVRAASGATITVLITNECPLPCAPGQLDLSQQAFARLADPKAGRIPISWSLVSPGISRSISIRYKVGSSQYWCGIQVIGHRNPVAMLEVRAGGGWKRLPRTDYNYFLAADGTGCGGPIRITDIYGQRLTVSAIALKPDVAQATGLQFARH